LFRDYDADLGAIVRTLSAGTRCARYVVVTRTASMVSGTNQVVQGLGIVDHGGLQLNIKLYALSVLRLYDGETFAVLRQRAASLGQLTLLADIRGPHRGVDKSFWPDSPDVAQNARLRDAIRELVGQSLEMTLSELKPTD